MIKITDIRRQSETDFIIKISVGLASHDATAKINYDSSVTRELWVDAFFRIANIPGSISDDFWKFVGGSPISFPLSYTTAISEIEEEIFMALKCGLPYKTMLRNYRNSKKCK